MITTSLHLTNGSLSLFAAPTQSQSTNATAEGLLLLLLQQIRGDNAGQEYGKVP